MAFNGMVLTNLGLALQAKVQAGTTLSFTKLKIGDGVLASGASLETLTDLIDPKQIVAISSVSVVNGECTISGMVTNTGLATGFNVNEIGVFATDPTAGEILYAIANAGGQCDYLPAGGGAIVVESLLNVVLAVGNSASITAVVNTALYATQAMLVAGLAEYVPLAGGTMTGKLVLSADPTVNLGAATKEYVDTSTSSAMLTASGAIQIVSKVISIITGSITSAMLATGAAIGNITNGTITAVMLATGAALANLGYTPANKAGDTFTGAVTATGFSGPLTGNVTGAVTGNVTGNVSGSSGSCTGNSATSTLAAEATILANTRTINGLSFNGGSNVANADYVISQSLGATSYRKWNSGLIEQWGYSTAVSSGSELTINFPTPFLSAINSATVTLIATPGSSGNNDGVLTVSSSTLTTLTVDAGSTGGAFYWEAKGQ